MCDTYRAHCHTTGRVSARLLYEIPWYREMLFLFQIRVALVRRYVSFLVFSTTCKERARGTFGPFLFTQSLTTMTQLPTTTTTHCRVLGERRRAHRGTKRTLGGETDDVLRHGIRCSVQEFLIVPVHTRRCAAVGNKAKA